MDEDALRADGEKLRPGKEHGPLEGVSPEGGLILILLKLRSSLRSITSKWAVQDRGVGYWHHASTGCIA